MKILGDIFQETTKYLLQEIRQFTFSNKKWKKENFYNSKKEVLLEPQ
jgi:hypothetical protein